VEHIKHLLVQIGLEPDRVRMFQMSSAEANQFVQAAKDMTEQIESLGPNPLKSNPPQTVE